ncbi:MAG: hypothetical protein MHMPM18_004342 [Marteilia pararefringens]
MLAGFRYIYVVYADIGDAFSINLCRIVGNSGEEASEACKSVEREIFEYLLASLLLNFLTLVADGITFFDYIRQLYGYRTLNGHSQQHSEI